MTMFEGMRLVDRIGAVATDALGPQPTDLVGRLELALRLARGTLAVAEKDGAVTDENAALQVARLATLLDELDDLLPPIEAWCVVKVYTGPVATVDDTVWAAFLTREQAEHFAPAIEEAFRVRRYMYPDRFVVRRAEARVEDFIAPTTTAKEYADEIRRYFG